MGRKVTEIVQLGTSPDMVSVFPIDRALTIEQIDSYSPEGKILAGNYEGWTVIYDNIFYECLILDGENEDSVKGYLATLSKLRIDPSKITIFPPKSCLSTEQIKRLVESNDYDFMLFR